MRLEVEFDRGARTGIGGRRRDLQEERKCQQWDKHSVTLRHNSDGFDFDEKLGPKKGGHLHRGARRRVSDIDELVVDFAVVRQMRTVDDVDIELCDVGERTSRGFHRGLQVFENLLRLGTEVAGTYQMAGSVQRYLSRDEHWRAALYSRQVRVAIRPMHRHGR